MSDTVIIVLTILGCMWAIIGCMIGVNVDCSHVEEESLAWFTRLSRKQKFFGAIGLGPAFWVMVALMLLVERIPIWGLALWRKLE